MFEKIYTVSIFIVQTERKQGEVGRHELFPCVGAWRNGNLHRAAAECEMIFEKRYTVSTITTSENPNILKLNLNSRHFTKQMYIYFYPEPNYILKLSML